jgi:hypothetical protein
VEMSNHFCFSGSSASTTCQFRRKFGKLIKPPFLISNSLHSSKDKFDLASGNLLVIGIDTSRPPRATAFERFQLKKAGMEDLSSDEPMVVGVSRHWAHFGRKSLPNSSSAPTTWKIRPSSAATTTTSRRARTNWSRSF